ncbi:MAG TPA: metallophosphoesterase [Vitreimonas sp.]|uniref:metallophosphoesterase n=1 Tax=Vitreimonas sp. TaxID=3069702 RepID=UPI002D57B4FC|nr:metallophosphoesterase [Vitreimonas sp.]HYD89706.1 metallophosphoesterase [Vitreimonas sp.]
MPHPHLWPAIIGAVLGLALVAWACVWLFKRWQRLSPRRRWSLFALIGVIELAIWINIYAWFIEPNLLVVREVEIVSEDWRGAPLTIAAIGDTHVGGPHVDSARMGRIVKRINELRPELVVLLGDYVGGHAAEATRTPAENQEILGGVATFAALRPRYGTVAVLGNHDSWYDRASITEALQNAGVGALWNRHLVIRRSGGNIVIAGIADATTGNPDFAAALDGAPADADTIALSHSPDPFEDMPDGPALMLAAHSHCGQVSIPLFGRPIVPIENRRYACNLVEENGRRMYVTSGIGTSVVPVRFLNPPEIVLITIRGNSD